jgi:hypothetical protein
MAWYHPVSYRNHVLVSLESRITNANEHWLAYSGAMDITLAILPWYTIRKLQIKNAEKLGVAIAMSMGVLYVEAGFLMRELSLTIESLQRWNNGSSQDSHHSVSRHWRLYL